MNSAEWKDYLFSLLSDEQRAQLAHELWESIDRAAPSILSDEEKRAELRRRVRAADAGEMARHRWEDIERRFPDPKA